MKLNELLTVTKNKIQQTYVETMFIRNVKQIFWKKNYVQIIKVMRLKLSRLLPTPIISKLRRRSKLVLLNIVFPLFCINLVSLPANTTTPQHHLLFLRTQPRNNILSLSSIQLFPFQFKVPSNLLRLLLGASHTISPRVK